MIILYVFRCLSNFSFFALLISINVDPIIPTIKSPKSSVICKLTAALNPINDQINGMISRNIGV